MKLYHYNPESGLYLGSSIASVDPAERDAVIKAAIEASPDASSVQVTIDHWIMPAHCTSIVPPKSDPKTETVNFIGGRWTINEIPKPPPPTEADKKVLLVGQAQSALRESDTALMLLYEQGKPVPNDLKKYREDLRAIIANPKLGTELPKPPASK